MDAPCAADEPVDIAARSSCFRCAASFRAIFPGTMGQLPARTMSALARTRFPVVAIQRQTGQQMGIDLDYFEKRVRSLEQALQRLQTDLEDAHEIAGRIVSEYQQWVKNETPGRELILRRLEELITRGSPRSVFAKTLVLEFGISRTKSYQMVKDYLVERDAAVAAQRANAEPSNVYPMR